MLKVWLQTPNNKRRYVINLHLFNTYEIVKEKTTNVIKTHFQILTETMSPSNMRNDHSNAKSADCYTPAEISSGFNASAISSEFPKRVNPFLKDVANFDQLNGNRGEGDGEEQDDDEDERSAVELQRMYNNNLKRASEPAILNTTSCTEMMINEEDEGVDEQAELEGDDEEEEEEMTRTIEEVGQEQLQQQEDSNLNETVDEENNSSKLLSDSDGTVWLVMCFLDGWFTLLCFQLWKAVLRHPASMRTFPIGLWLASRYR